jgi:potassium/chloride transporter 4/5/6
MLANMRLYGTILLLFMGLIVFVGVKYVNRFASACLAMVLSALVCIYLGFFTSPRGGQPEVCFIDGILLRSGVVTDCSPADVVNSTLPWLSNQSTFSGRQAAFPGFASNSIASNVDGHFLRKGEADTGVVGQAGQVVSDVTTTFTMMLAIFFPAATGEPPPPPPPLCAAVRCCR